MKIPLMLIETENGSYIYGVCDVWTPDMEEGHSESLMSRGVSHALYKIGFPLEKVVDEMYYTAFDGSVLWYTTLLDKSEVEYIGTEKSPTGRGSETGLFDIFIITDGTLTRYDIDTGEKRIYTLGDRYFSPIIYGAVGDSVLTGNYNAIRAFNGISDGNPYVWLTPDGDGVKIVYFDKQEN